jgi:N6-adenosine-specific RNA methylase IME4
VTWEGLNPPYRTIVADPPWPQQGGGPLVRGVGERFRRPDERPGPSLLLPYSTMTLAEIAALPVGELVGRQAHLYLWVTNGFLLDAKPILAAWGFTYSTTLVWAKEPMGGGLGGAYGIATEFVVFGYRGRVAARARIGRNWFTWKRPYSHTGKPMHSAKPPGLQDMIEQVSHGPYVELFCRQPRLGWDSWGWGYETAARARRRGSAVPAGS